MSPLRPHAARAAVVLLLLATACHRKVQVGTAPAPVTAKAPAIANGTEVVHAMHDAYAGKWYRNLTFQQQTTRWSATGAKFVQTWYEAGSIPGKLRIDFDTTGGGALFVGDSVFAFVNGKLARADTGMNDLLILGFDVYGQPAARSAQILGGRGYDLRKLSSGTWQGRPVWIVGAVGGDTTSQQFWVDKERLLFVRLLETRGSSHIDLRFDHYVKRGGGWVAEEVWQYVDGKPRLHEEYSNVKVDVAGLPAGLWNPREWGETLRWWR